MLSAQTTDKRVNIVTKELFSKYNSIEKLKDADEESTKSIVWTLEGLIENYNKDKIIYCWSIRGFIVPIRKWKISKIATILLHMMQNSLY